MHYVSVDFICVLVDPDYVPVDPIYAAVDLYPN
jgi:hypothetical protein